MSNMNEQKLRCCYCDDEIQMNWILNYRHDICKECIHVYMKLKNNEFFVPCKCDTVTFVNVNLRLTDKVSIV